MLKNKKGFTLIELLVAISIMAIILILALPQMSNLKNKNEKTKYKKYAETLITSAKLYVDSYSEDIFGNNPNGCVDIKYQQLKEKKLVKDIKVDDSTCAGDNTFVRVKKANDFYMYDVSIYCTKKGNEIYKKTLSGLCDNNPDFTGPEIILTQTTDMWTKGVSDSATVTISDNYGMLENTKIKISWKQDGVAYSESEHDFKNKRGDNPLTLEIKVPQNKTGIFELTITPIDVRDSIGNRTESAEKVVFKLDNEPPSKPTIKAYKWIDNNTKPTSTEGLVDPYTSNDWTNKKIYTIALGSIDLHSGENNPEKTTYYYKTTGVTKNEENKEKSYRNIEKEGISYIEYKACDPLGNCTKYSDSPKFIIKIDTTKPRNVKSTTRTGSSSGTVRTNSDKWTKDTLWWGEWSAKDDVTGIDTSGIAHYEYSTNCTKTKSGNLKSSYTYNTTGERKYCIRAIDGAGNASEWSKAYYFNVDKTPPDCGSHNGSTTWTNSSRIITLHCRDNVNCKQTTYQAKYEDSGISKSTDTITIEDHVGNTRKCPINVYVDKKIPTLTGGNIGAVSGSNINASVKTTPKANDQICTINEDGTKNCSGIKEIRYIIKTNNNTPSKDDFKSAGISRSYQRACGQTNYAWAVAIDYAGNMSSVKSLGSSKDGKNQYSDYGNCSKECGGGTKTRTNSCALVTTGLSKTCNTRSCCSETNTKAGEWTNCNKNCGGGTQTRTIYYTSAYDGSSCGTTIESKQCNTDACCSKTSTKWSGTWSSCSKSCGPGTQTMTGTKYSTYDSSISCGSTSKSRECNLGACEETVNATRYYDCDSYYITTCNTSTCKYTKKNGVSTTGTISKSLLTTSRGNCNKTYCNPYIIQNNGSIVTFNVSPMKEQCKIQSYTTGGCSKEGSGDYYIKAGFSSISVNSSCSLKITFSGTSYVYQGTAYDYSTWKTFNCGNDQYCTGTSCSSSSKVCV